MSQKSVVAVYGFLSTGRRVRILGETPETRMFPAGFEIGMRVDADGMWKLTWLPACDIVELEVVVEVVKDEESAAAELAA